MSTSSVCDTKSKRIPGTPVSSLLFRDSVTVSTVEPECLRRCLLLKIQFSSVSKNHLRSRIPGPNVGDRRAVLCRTQNDGDFITGLKRSSRPTGPAQDPRTVRFDSPVHNVPVAVFHVQVNLRMGIGPYKFGDDSLDGNASGFVVCRIAVVRRRGATQK